MQDSAIIKKLRSSNQRRVNKGLEWIKKNWYSEAYSYVLNIGVPESDAEDIFYASLLRLLQSIQKGNFKGESSLKTYFSRICKNKAIDYLRANNLKSFEELKDLEIEDPDNKLKAIIKQEIVDLWFELLQKLDEKCRKILEYKKLEISHKEIAQKLGLKSAQSVANKNQDCREKLRKLGDEDPHLKKKIAELL